MPRPTLRHGQCSGRETGRIQIRYLAAIPHKSVCSHRSTKVSCYRCDPVIRNRHCRTKVPRCGTNTITQLHPLPCDLARVISSDRSDSVIYDRHCRAKVPGGRADSVTQLHPLPRDLASVIPRNRCDSVIRDRYCCAEVPGCRADSIAD